MFGLSISNLLLAWANTTDSPVSVHSNHCCLLDIWSADLVHINSTPGTG